MKRTIKWLGIIGMVVGPLGATTYRVTVSNDIGLPGTLSWALAQVRAGDTVLLEVDVNAGSNQYSVAAERVVILGQEHAVRGDPTNTAFTLMANGIQMKDLTIEDFYKGVEVWADSVLLENLRVSVQGGVGVWFDGARWARARYLKVTSLGNVGAYLRNALEVTIENSEFYGNKIGVHLIYSQACTLRAVSVHDNNTSIGSWGLVLYSSERNYIENLEAYNNGVLNADGSVKLEKAKGNVLSGGRVYKSGVGVYFYDSDSNSVRDYAVWGCWRGVYLDLSSDGNLLTGLDLHDNNDCGLYAGRFSSGNTVEKSSIYYNAVGVKVDNALGNTFSGLTVHDNDLSGVVFTGGCAQNTLQGSWVYRNGQAGVLINSDAEANQILSTMVYYNGTYGVYIDGAKNNLIKGSWFFYNQKDGVALVNSTSVGNRITQNSFWDNGELAIDLGDDGVTPRDGVYNSDLPNRGIDYPDVKEGYVVIPGDSIIVRGFAGPSFAGATVEVYAADPDPSGFGEGRRYIASGTVLPDGTFEVNVGGIDPPLNTSDSLTLLVIDADGNTSEFSGQYDPMYQGVDELAGGRFEAYWTPGFLVVITSKPAHQTLRVYNASGALVQSRQVELLPGLNRLPLDLPTGTYVALLGPAKVKLVVLR